MTRLIVLYSCSECPNMNYVSAAIKDSGRQEVCSVEENKFILDPVAPPPGWCPLDEDKYGIPEGIVLSLSEDRIISLYNKDGGKTGEISFGEKNITFKGEIDKSADALFGLLKYVVDYFRKDK